MNNSRYLSTQEAQQFMRCASLDGRTQTASSPQPDGGGLRHDTGKPRFDLMPPEAMEALARHYEVGARKYQDRNWERGMLWCRCFGSLMRHAWAWMRGDDFDQETGSHHMISAAWNCIALATYAMRKVGTDDRVLPPSAPAE
jgi:hypothetical protein